MCRGSLVIRVSKYFIPYVIFLIIIGYKGKLIYAFFIVIVHELVHYMVAKHYNFSGFDIELIAVGAVLKFKELDNASPKEDLIISLSGPMANIVLGIIFYLANNKAPCIEFEMLCYGNMAIGIFNMIPAFPLDGGRVLRDILYFKFSYKKANKIMINISVIIGAFLMFFYILLFLKGISNFNVGIIGLFIIVSSLKEKERISYIIMGDIIKKKYRFTQKGYIENKNVSIYYKKDLISVMALFDKNKYNIFTILDDNMKVVDIIYEEDIIDGLKLYGNISLEEFMKIHS